MFENISILN